MSFDPPQQPGQPDYGTQPAQPAQPYEAPPASYPPPPAQQYAPPPAAYPPAGPPPGYPPAGPPPGYAPAPARTPGPAFDPSSVNPMDWAILGLGFLTFIFSFFAYYTASASFGGISVSASESAWHGFFGWFAALVALASAGLIAVELFAPQVKIPVPIRLASLIGFAVATLCVLLALAVIPGTDGAEEAGVNTGHGFGYWVSLVFIIAALVLSVLRLKATGGRFPWEKGPAGGQPPVPPTYGG